MIRAHVDRDGRLILPGGQSIAELLDRDVLVLVAPVAGQTLAAREGEQARSMPTSQGVHRQYTDGRTGQSLRFDGGVLVFEAGAEAEVVEAETIERFIRQDREERMQFPE